MTRPRIAYTVTPKGRPTFLQWCKELNVSRMDTSAPDEWRKIKEAWAANRSSQIVGR